MDNDAPVSQDPINGAAIPSKGQDLVCPICNRVFDSSLKFCPHDGTLLHSENSREKSRIGMVIDDKYRLVRLIGTGGLAEVYEAHHLFLLKKVAIKFLKSVYANDQSMLERFRREALLVSMISHPNVVKVEDFGALEDGTLFMIMELLMGQTLASAMEKTAFSLREAVQVVIQACEGIAAAHAKGIIHRDLKPANLFLTDDGCGARLVKVLDLGVAKLRNEGIDRSITKTGIVMGSPGYMAPEQCAGSYIDFRSDVYALGMVLYELVTDRVAFEAVSTAEMMLKQSVVEPTRPSVHAPERNIPQELENVIMKAIAKNPEERFACVQDMLEGLRQVSSRVEGNDISPSQRMHTPTGLAITRADEPSGSRKNLPREGRKDNSHGDADLARQIAPGIFWVGHRTGELLERNTYLLKFEGREHLHTIVVDPGPHCDLQAVTTKICSVIGSLQAIDAIFINHQDPDVAANAAYFQRVNPKAMVWCSEDSWRLSRFYDLIPGQHVVIDQLWSRSMTLPTGHRLLFVPTPFCHERGAVMLYDPDSRVLFSGDLFGGISTKQGLFGDASCWAGIRSFHEIYMPSSEALRNAVAQIRALSPPPLVIAPQHGCLIAEPLIDPFLQRMAELDVGIHVVLTSHSKTNYLRAINELLPEISSVLGTDSVADTLILFQSDQSFRKLFAIVDNVVVDIRMDPEAAMVLLLQRILSGARGADEAGRVQTIAIQVLQRWSLVPPDLGAAPVS
jgi:eukaryotic-like serine/threonine-protein kinase